MKKLLILLLVLSLLVCFAACNDKDEPIESTPAETSSAAVESSEESTEEQTKAEKPEKEQVSTGDGWTANY